MRFTLSNFEKEKVLEEYQSGKSLKQIADEFGCSKKPIRNAILDSNVQMRGSSREVRKYNVDEDYFDNIDTPNKAYVLGLLYADGCNVINRSKWLYQWRLQLKSDDIQILKDIADDLHYDGIIHNTVKDKNGSKLEYSSLVVCGKHMCESLCDCGVVPNKTSIISFPYWLGEELIPHFIRGYFDGDGCINAHGYASLAGNESFISQIYEVICKAIFVQANIYQCSQAKNTYQIVMSGKKNSQVFLDWIYKNSDLKLKRKFDRYTNMYL